MTNIGSSRCRYEKYARLSATKNSSLSTTESSLKSFSSVISKYHRFTRFPCPVCTSGWQHSSLTCPTDSCLVQVHHLMKTAAAGALSWFGLDECWILLVDVIISCSSAMLCMSLSWSVAIASTLHIHIATWTKPWHKTMMATSASHRQMEIRLQDWFEVYQHQCTCHARLYVMQCMSFRSSVLCIFFHLASALIIFSFSSTRYACMLVRTWHSSWTSSISPIWGADPFGHSQSNFGFNILRENTVHQIMYCCHPS